MSWLLKVRNSITGRDKTLDLGEAVDLETDVSILPPLAGYCFKSDDGSTWRLTIDNSGNLITTKIV